MLLQAAEWYNYPGLELWKFANLAIFTGAAIYILRKPISQALASRREAIQQELVTSQNERDQALARVAEADALLGRLDDDVRKVQEQTREEATSERQRIATSTEREIEKLKQQAQRWKRPTSWREKSSANSSQRKACKWRANRFAFRCGRKTTPR